MTGEQSLVVGGVHELPSKLTDTKFHQLAAVPAELEWFANLDNPRTRRAYQADMRDFMGFVGIRAHLRGGDSGEQGGGHGRRDVLEAVREQGIAEHAIAIRGVALVVAVVVEEGLTVEIDLVQTILAIGIEQVSEGYRAELGLAGSQW